MRTNTPSLWCKPKSGILFSLCMPQRQRPVLLVRMPTADANLYSWPACHLLFRMEGMRCFLVSCTLVLRQPHIYLLVTSLIHDIIEAYNHSLSLMRIRRVVPTGVNEWHALYFSLIQPLLAQIASLVSVSILACAPLPYLPPLQ